MCDNANRLALRLQDRPLFDMQFEHRVDFARADLFIAHPANARQFLAKSLAVRITARFGVVFGMQPGKHARGEHGRGEPCALFIGPVGHNNRVFGLNAQIVQAAHHFQSAQDAQHPVIAPAGGLGVQMAAHIDRQRLGVGACTGGKHIAHRVHPHCHVGITAPARKQVAALAVSIGQGLAVVSARNAWADLGHLVQAVPKARRIDAQVFTGCGHGSLPLGRQGLDASCDESFPDRMVRTKRTTA